MGRGDGIPLSVLTIHNVGFDKIRCFLSLSLQVATRSEHDPVRYTIKLVGLSSQINLVKLHL